MEFVESIENNNNIETNTRIQNNDHGWQKVVYPKRQRKLKPDSVGNQINGKLHSNGNLANGGDNIFHSIELQSEDRRRRIQEAQRAAEEADAIGAAVVRSRHRSDDDYDESDEDIAGKEHGKVDEVKKVKVKKVKKPKVTVPEAAAKIDPSDLAAFLAEITESYADQQEIQMMRFADYFGRAFSGVTASQFPWVKTFKETVLAKIVDTPISHIPEAVYKTSVDWINHRSLDALSSFVLWSLDSILADYASQQVGAKGSKKGVQQASKSQVAIFVVLAMVLRRKPDALTSVLPTLRETQKYQGQDKLPVIVWMMAQASQGDLAVGMYSWAHNLLPTVTGKSCNPQSRDLILQLVERLISSPKAETILVNGAVRRGERLIPPSSFEILMRVTFPAPSARVKATERFEALYPTLKKIALAGSHGSKAMKQVAQQIFSFAVKAAGESPPELSKEAAGIVLWCLGQNTDVCKQWDKVYEDNLQSSVNIMKKLLEEWKEQSTKLSSLDPLRETIKEFRRKNEKALGEEDDAAQQALYKEANKYCKLMMGRLSRGHGCMKSMVVLVIALGVGAAFVSPNVESWDWNKLSDAVTQTFNHLLEK